MSDKDLFNNPVIADELLRNEFIEPPFSVLNTKSKNWQRRKDLWRAKGLKSEVGRSSVVINCQSNPTDIKESAEYVSIFDPALCEVVYHWFCPPGGTILDPFAGGSVRGIVAHYLGFKYKGIDIRLQQIESNIEQGQAILAPNNQPGWFCADSYELLDSIHLQADLIFSCPPYSDLEVYSDLPGDISNMPYSEFVLRYDAIINKSAKKLKQGGFACFVVGEIRDKSGYYKGFIPETIKAFERAGLRYYNDIVLLNSPGSAALRAKLSMVNKKVVKIHQNVLIFKKP